MKDAIGMPRRVLFTLLAPLTLATILSCSSQPESPEQRVRVLLKRAEEAAKEKSLGLFKKVISENYEDSANRDKRAVIGLLRYHFLANRSIYLFTRINEIVFPHPGEAVVTVSVATAGRPIASEKDLLRIRADLHRFVITLTEEGEGDWKALRSEWRRAGPKDFL